MPTTEQIPPPKVRWDLAALFLSADDPKIQQTWTELMQKAEDFDKKYRGKIDSPDVTVDLLVEAIEEYEYILQTASKPINFAYLSFTCDTGNPHAGAFMQKQMEKGTALSVKMIFFALELQTLDEQTMERLLADPKLEGYKHFIQTERAFRNYRLNEGQEVVMEEMSNSGSRAWVRLFEEVTANQVFTIENRKSLPREIPEELTQQEVLALMRDPSREIRQAAADSLTKGLTEQKRVLTFIFNNIFYEKSVEDRLRKHEYPEQARHLNNELDRETVDMVIDMCRQHYSLVERFYNVKKQILGIPELTHIDRYAPLFETSEKVSFDRAKELILDSFGNFSDTMRTKASEFFDSRWIDAEPRKGKQGGAFCSYNTPDTHPVVFQSYLNEMNDVMTLAHELGHGVHASLSRKQSYVNFRGTLPLAELASTFGEMLVFEKIVEQASLTDKLILYAEKIEGIFSTIFRQAALFEFERRCHYRRRNEGELDHDEIGDIWQEELQAMFGNSIALGDQHRCWWSYVSHFIAAPFYVYAYSVGELLVLSLFTMAKAEGKGFADKYVEMLSLGGSKTPHELMATVGVDLNSKEFWQGGFNTMENLITEFEELWSHHAAKQIM